MTKWKGTFWSTNYTLFYFWTFVKGTIETNIPEGQDKSELPFKLTYTGMYNNAITKEGTISIGSQQDTMIASLNNYAMTSRGPVGICSSDITFNITSRTDDVIKGTYRLHGPHDVGTFELHRC